MFFVNLFEFNFLSPVYLPVGIFVLNQLFISSFDKFENLREFGFIFNDKLKPFQWNVKHSVKFLWIAPILNPLEVDSH